MGVSQTEVDWHNIFLCAASDYPSMVPVEFHETV